MPEPVVGSVPRGEDYFGQEALISEIWARLQRGNVLLVAPRRFGKTAAMYRLLDDPQQGFRPLYVYVQPISTPADFMIEILAALLRDRHFSRVLGRVWEGTKGFGAWLRNLPENIDVGGIKVQLREATEVPAKWQEYGQRVMDGLAEEDPRLLLLIDEFADMMNAMAQRNKEEAAQLLGWFRGARTAPATRTRFVISGSTNLITSLDALGLVDKINDLSVLRLKPFDHDVAIRYVRAVFQSKHVPLSPAVETRIIQLLGAPVPYLLAVLLEAILERSRAKGGALDAELVESAFEEDLLGGGTSVTFLHYRSRLDRHYPGREADAARAILNLLSRADSAVTHDTLYQTYLRTRNVQPSPKSHEAFVRLMQKLENDFYVVSADSGFAFFSRVLHLWWKRDYGYQEG
ncbi:MAG: hypothetical protein FJ279_22880 [Planctomycetes bacterium]|nr:hypothetical protein [Planctomycetota bacterium]